MTLATTFNVHADGDARDIVRIKKLAEQLGLEVRENRASDGELMFLTIPNVTLYVSAMRDGKASKTVAIHDRTYSRNVYRVHQPRQSD